MVKMSRSSSFSCQARNARVCARSKSRITPFSADLRSSQVDSSIKRSPLHSLAAFAPPVTLQTVPFVPTHFVGGPADQMERIQADRGALCPIGHDGADPLGPVAGHELALGRPDHLGGQVVADDRQGALTPPRRWRRDPSKGRPARAPRWPPERVNRPPGDPVTSSGGQRRRADGVVDDEALERPGAPAVVAGACDGGHRRTIGGDRRPGGRHRPARRWRTRCRCGATGARRPGRRTEPRRRSARIV